MFVVTKKFWLFKYFFKILHTCALSDKINFEKLKKVAKKLIEGVGIWTPVTLTSCMINLN